MVEGVVTDLEAVLVQLANDLRVAHDALADHEEGGRDTEPLQRLGDARGPLRVGAVVEAERDPPGRREGLAHQLPAIEPEHRLALVQHRRPGRRATRGAVAGPMRGQPVGKQQQEHRR